VIDRRQFVAGLLASAAVPALRTDPVLVAHHGDWEFRVYPDQPQTIFYFSNPSPRSWAYDRFVGGGE
jgi:hypothetical protein